MKLLVIVMQIGEEILTFRKFSSDSRPDVPSAALENRLTILEFVYNVMKLLGIPWKHYTMFWKTVGTKKAFSGIPEIPLRISGNNTWKPFDIS